MTLCACWVVVYDVDHDVIDVTVDNDVSGVERNGDVADGSLVSLDHSYAAALSKGYFETDHSNIVAPDHSYNASSPRTMKKKMYSTQGQLKACRTKVKMQWQEISRLNKKVSSLSCHIGVQRETMGLNRLRRTDEDLQ